MMMSSDGVTSPESTVTSLFATSGHLQSSLDPDPVPTITYRDKHYVSASEALDAYIADFQKTSTGKLKITKQLSVPHPRNRDVLKTSLTEGELNFLNIPVRNRDSDRLSMTTDDLLALPIDGSLPVTRTSAFLSQSEILPEGRSFNSSAWSQLRPSGAPKRFMHPNPQRAPDTGRSSRKSLPVDDLLIGSSLHRGLNHRPSHQKDPRHTPRSHHLPRWLTSQKSEMDFSGITSVPDLKYPGWLEQCEESSAGSSRIAPPHRIPSWVDELEESRGERHSETESHKDVKGHPGALCGSEDLCDLRKLHLQISEPVNRQQAQDNKLFKDDKIDSLIFRAEQMLNSSSLGLCGPVTGHNNNSGDTDDSLDADRSWENPPVTFKSPVTVGGEDEQSQPEEQQRNLSSASGSSGYGSRKHPGPVEALKHMLLRLQAVEHNINQSNTSDTQREEEEQVDREENDLKRSGESLQRVLHHVDRLKTLVDVMNEKKDESHRET
ncbi:lung adenoma susceptibility protein 2 [Paramisgurnus dabryanus]|uniref:lung adenoma susceptibility protein 2 n=1 Tax=Paramisgurnus dabryanus TaxID=90735 RepID=UPI0031F3FF35